MGNEFYVIQEEFFDEDANRSSYEPLNNLIFSSSKEAKDYLMGYIDSNKFQSVEDISNEEDYCFLVTDRRFPHKYRGEGSTKEFYINKLTLFKID